jgi:hypothetical protein
MGIPYFPKVNLPSLFEELFCKNGGPRLVRDLEVPTQIYFTDLYSLRARVCPYDEALPRALAKSCNFPFAFTGRKSDMTEVDGGLALNLPVDDLKSRVSTFGEVIAVSFDTGFNTREENRLISFIQSLFSAAIESGVERSRLLIGPHNVFTAGSEIGTFDFGRALKEGLEIHYNLARERFSSWLENWLTPYETNTPIYHSAVIRPIISTNPLPAAIVRQIEDDLRLTSCIHMRRGWLSDIAIFEQGKFTGYYRTRMMMIFKVLRPISVLQVDFEIGEEDKFDTTQLSCSASTEHGESLSFIPSVQKLTAQEEKGPQKFRLRLIPLRPGPQNVVATRVGPC